MVQENGHHDVGGATVPEQIPKDHPLKLWELRVHSLATILANQGLMNVDE